MNETVGDGYREGYRGQFARAERLLAACRLTAAYVDGQVWQCQRAGRELPEDLVELRRVVYVALGEEEPG
ncbi:MAG: hypothetical protein NTU85_03575 [Candidatus Kaiserbacteria bacterium]|nr:hypothetical protein [Candidatus Kaiserbacteria bacterium]